MDEYELIEYYSYYNSSSLVTLRGRISINSRGDMATLKILDFNGNKETIKIKMKSDWNKSIELYSNPSGDIIVLTCGNNVTFFNYKTNSYYICENLFSNYRTSYRIVVLFSPFDQIFLICEYQYIMLSLSSAITRKLEYNPQDCFTTHNWSIPTTSDGRYILRHGEGDIIETSGIASYTKNNQYRHRINFEDKYSPSFSLDFYKGYYIYAKIDRRKLPPYYHLLSEKYYDDADDVDLSSQLGIYRIVVDYINEMKSCISNVVTMHNRNYFITTLRNSRDELFYILIVDKRTNILHIQSLSLFHNLEGVRLFNRKILIQDLRVNHLNNLRTRIYDFTLKWAPSNHYKFIKEIRETYEMIFMCLWVKNIPRELIYEFIEFFDDYNE